MLLGARPPSMFAAAGGEGWVAGCECSGSATPYGCPLPQYATHVASTTASATSSTAVRRVDRLGKKRRTSFRRRIFDRRLLSIDPKVARLQHNRLGVEATG